MALRERVAKLGIEKGVEIGLDRRFDLARLGLDADGHLGITREMADLLEVVCEGGDDDPVVIGKAIEVKVR